jgi:hypothetical protein
MKKRILFILVIGVSFAPPVFAGSNSFLSKPIKLAHTGEQDDVDGSAKRCDAGRTLVELDQEIKSEGKSKASAAN